MSTLIVLRHGRSVWNALGLFTGWVDVDLAEEGIAEAVNCARLLASSGISPDVSHSSSLKRAFQTAEIVLDGLGRGEIPTHRSWRLNERHYGVLQGKSKQKVLEEFGADQYMAWRRSYDIAPPPTIEESPAPTEGAQRSAGTAEGVPPLAESLADVLARLLPYWHRSIVPDLERGRTVLVTAHSNSLRALIKHLDGLDDEEILDLNVPTGIPLIYHLDGRLRPLTPGGVYLDASAAAAAISAVANEGRTGASPHSPETKRVILRPARGSVTPSDSRHTVREP